MNIKSVALINVQVKVGRIIQLIIEVTQNRWDRRSMFAIIIGMKRNLL